MKMSYIYLRQLQAELLIKLSSTIDATLYSMDYDRSFHRRIVVSYHTCSDVISYEVAEDEGGVKCFISGNKLILDESKSNTI